MGSDRRTKAELLAEIDTLHRRLDALEDADVRRAQVEHALRLSEAKFHSAFHRSPIAMSLSTLPEGRFVDVNEKFLALSGRSREEVLGRTPADMGMWVDPRQRESVLAALERDGRVHDIDVSLRTQSGEIRRFLWSADVVPVAGVRHLLVSALDITERILAEEAVREGEERLRAVIDEAPFGAHFYELVPGRILLFMGGNRAADRILGLDHSLLVGKPIEEAFPGLAGTEVPALYARIASEGGTRDLEDYSYDAAGVKGVFEVHVFGTGRDRMAVFFRDVTERREAEEERRLLEARVQQSQRLESLGVMAGGIAHDFNNLLSGVLGNADLAALELAPDAPVRQRIEQIQSAAVRAAELTGQLLSYAGKGSFLVKPTDLSAIVREMGHLLEVSIPKKVALRRSFEDGLPAVEADPSQVRQVIMNLIINAAEAVGDREGSISVTTRRFACGPSCAQGEFVGECLPGVPYVALEVADSGRGMDGETLGRIFEPFFTTKSTGRGLGLASVLGIVRGHHGAIKVRTTPGSGSVFTVILPATGVEALAGAGGGEKEDGWRGSGLVLVADDEEAVRSMARRMLEVMGFEALTAADGREALDLFKKRADDVRAVLLDVNMPRLDGRQALRELRRMTPGVPVILTSGYPAPTGEAALTGEGFLQKPFRLRELRDSLRRAVEKEDREGSEGAPEG